MKKTSTSKRKNPGRELAAEYRFDYTKSKPNRFAASMAGGAIAVVLEPDVAAVFNSSKKINAVLRSIISKSARAKSKA